jgi:hypothetical protein
MVRKGARSDNISMGKNRVRNILVAAIIISLSPSLLAQNELRFDVYAGLAAGWYDLHVGAHKNFGLGFGWRPFIKSSSPLRGIGAEFEANHSWGMDGNVHTQTIGTGTLLYNFSMKGAEPFVGFGFGGSDHTEAHGLSAPGNPRAIWTVQTSVGMKFPLGQRWYIRPQFDVFNGDYSSGNGPTRWFYRGGGGIGYRF